jgi:hypothetical protein
MASALVSALNSHTPIQTGYNGHAEYGWSNDIREQIVQLSFQIVRTTEEGVRDLGTKLYNMAMPLKNIVEKSNPVNNGATASVSPTLDAKQSEAGELLDMIRRMVLQTRDIEAGKGEYSIGREFIRQWYRIYPLEALQMIKYYVTPIPQLTDDGVKHTHPYGSWKDIKFLWRVFGGERCPSEVLGFLIRLVNDQLRSDMKSKNPTLVARWVSRESASKKNAVPFKAFYRALAEDYFSNYMATARTPESRIKAQRKCYQHYRQQVLVPLNKKLRTPQMKQCAREWADIDYKNDVTSITMRKQTRAFMYKKKDGTSRGEDPDRVQAASNFEDFVNGAVEKGEAIKGKRIGFDVIARDAWSIAGGHGDSVSSTEISVQDLQWESMLELLGDMGDMVAMIDLSGSMAGDPMNAAMGIGLAVASKSNIGRCAMTFSNSPTWMNFEGCNKLSEMMSKMYQFRDKWGTSTNFTAALKLILDKCVQLKLPAAEVANIKLLVLSDMQIDQYGNEKVTDTMWDNITQRYAEAGRRAIGEPYKPGHIIFWNLSHTHGFPTLSTTPNTTMFSGFSPVLLNDFAKKGLEALQETTPFNQLQEQLANERYNILDFA